MKQLTKITPTGGKRKQLNNLVNVPEPNITIPRLDLDLVALPYLLRGAGRILANKVPRCTIGDTKIGAGLQHIIGECATPVSGCHCDRAMERPG